MDADLSAAVKDVLEYDRIHPVSGGMRTRLDRLFNEWNRAAFAAPAVTETPDTVWKPDELERFAPAVTETASHSDRCNAWAGDGPCILPRGHNMGRADVPGNHDSGLAAPAVTETTMDADLRAAARDLCRFAGRYLVGDSDVQPQDVQVAIHDVHAALAAPAVTEPDLRAAIRQAAEMLNDGNIEYPSHARALEILNAALDAAPAVIEPDLRAAIVVEMENEGVVTWGDERHRERFLAEPDVDVD